MLAKTAPVTDTSGSYLGEGDIERFDDRYGRA